MLLKEYNGIFMYLERCLSGEHVFTVKGKGFDTLKWYGYQNHWQAENYFNKCVKNSKKNIS
jgi:hypothetical protein